MTHRSASTNRLIRLAVQLVGFAIGLALLFWCTQLALSDENREQFQRLAEAPRSVVAGLLALSVATIVLNGLIFERTLAPVRRLPVIDVLSVNAIATFLNYLPFKLSVISRIAIHNRRDRVPIGQIAGWLAAVGLGGAITFGPIAIIGAWRAQIDAIWIFASLVSVGACALLTLFLARHFGGDDGRVRLERIADTMRVPFRKRIFAARIVIDAHSGLDMLAHPQTLATVVLLRLVDLAVQAGRFMIAASLLNIALSPGEAFLFAVVYFFIGVITPFGMLGTREGGTIGLAALIGMSESGFQAFAAVPLLVTATEAVVSLALAGVAIAWLRPNRLLRPADPSV